MRFRSSYSGVARSTAVRLGDDFYRDFAKASFYFFASLAEENAADRIIAHADGRGLLENNRQRGDRAGRVRRSR